MKRKAKRYRALAEYYDAEYEQNVMLQRDVPFLLQHMPKRRQKVLELAAGTGRVAIPLAQAGHRVVGVDYATDMLQLAERKRQMVGLAERDLRLLHGDVLKLDLGERFDWVCILFNTFLNFTTMAEQDRVLQAAQAHLKRGGRLWIDIFNPDLGLLAEEQSTDLDPMMFYVPSLDRTVSRTVDVERDTAVQLQRVTFNYRWFETGGQEHHEVVRFDLTYLFPRELQLLLERNGFAIEHLWGDHDGSAVRSDSPRLIACARPK